MGPDLLPLSSYAELLELAERELELARAGDSEGLAALAPRRAVLTAALPATPPAEAEPLLRRTAALLAESGELIERALGDVAIELGRMTRGRDVRAYVGARPLPRALDRSA